MKHLINNVLRTKNMVELLHAMGIPVKKEQVTCKDERIIFNLESIKEGVELAADLQNLLQNDAVKLPIKRRTVAELLAEEITNATCSDSKNSETLKKSCLALLDILQLKDTLDEQQEYLDIQLPSAVYGPIFSALNYKYLSINGEKIKFNIKEYLKAHKQELILIDGQSPLLFAYSELFENRKVFYAEKKVSADITEVTPYFFVPDALTPPAYHFVLDTSGSMFGKNLDTLKKSVIELADALFQYQPDAVINISEFNTENRTVGNFRKQDMSRLKYEVNRLSADGSTRLYATVVDQLAMLTHSKLHNNILLFTDGINSSDYESLLINQLERTVESLGEETSLIRVKNKFFILSYGVKQPEVLQKVANAFASPIINTNTVDFIEALSQQDKLQEWAAARELFTCRLEVAGSSTLDTQSEEYVCSFDMSGQFVALKPQLHKNNERLHLTITDSNGKILLDDQRSLAKKPMDSVLLPGIAKTAVQHGVFAVQNTPKTDVPTPSVTPTFL